MIHPAVDFASQPQFSTYKRLQCVFYSFVAVRHRSKIVNDNLAERSVTQSLRASFTVVPGRVLVP